MAGLLGGMVICGAAILFAGVVEVEKHVEYWALRMVMDFLNAVLAVSGIWHIVRYVDKLRVLKKAQDRGG
jgi:hypothetical protein